MAHRPTDNHKLLCIAGGNGKDNQNLASTQCYDFTAGAWNPENADLGPLPEARWGMGYTQRSAGAVPQLWIVAGNGAFGDPTLPSPSTSSMASGNTPATLPTDPTYRTAATALDNTIYQSGGYVYDADLA